MAGLVDNPGTANLVSEDVVPLAQGGGGGTPAFQDFINAYRTGVITAEDIKRRGVVGTTPYEAEKAQNLAAISQADVSRKGAEQTGLDIEQVRPLQRQLAVSQTTGGIQQSDWANRINSNDAEIRHGAQREASDRALETGATQLFGNPQPDLYVIHPDQNQVKPEEFGDWVNRQVNAFQGNDKQRADYQNDLETRGEKGEEYQSYVNAVKNRTIKLDVGTPEYRRELRRRVDVGLTHQQLEQINFDTIRELGKAQAEAIAKAPEAARTAQQKGLQQILEEKNRSHILKSFAPQAEAFAKVDEIKNSGRAPSNTDDIGLLYEYVKLLDPTSAVREGEAKLAQSTVPTVKSWYNRAQGLFSDHNKFFDEATRNNLYQSLDSLKAGALRNVKPELQRLTTLAEQSKVPFDQVFTAPERQIISGTGAAPAAPAKPTITSTEAAKLQTYNSLGEVPPATQFFRDPQGNVRRNPNFRP